MNRGVNRQATFLDDQDRVEFGRLLGVGHERFGVRIHAYCLMDNHYHLLVHTPTGRLSDFMHVLGSVFARHVNERAARDGPLFRGRFHSVPILDDRQLLATVRYIHRNALDLPAVDEVDRYRWSSHRTYLGHRRRPSWLDTDLVLGWFGHDRSRFHRFVRDPLHGAPTVETARLSALVDIVLDERGTGSAPNLRRTVLLLLRDRLTATDQSVLDELLGHEHPAARIRAVRRAKRRARETPWLRETVERVLELAAAWPPAARHDHVVPGTTWS